jgi:transmembrane sensor
MNDPQPKLGAGVHQVIEARAAEFLQRRRLSRWSAVDQVELDDWLNQATAHRIAYLRLADGEALIERVSDREPAELKSLGPKSAWTSRFAILAVAASLGLLACLGLAVQSMLSPPPDRTYATGVGGLALIKFGEGTAIELNTNSAVRYRMTTVDRTVWLERGEAYFRVAHNAAHPFVVFAQGHRITDLGTEFLVREGRDLDVLLVKGSAQLAADRGETSVAMLVPGQEAVSSRGTTTIVKKSAQALADELAWRRGVVVFRETRLADAVREFNRYNETQLIIADQSIANLKFSAELKTDDFQDFLQLAQSALGVRVEKRGNNIYLFGNSARAPHSRRRRQEDSKGRDGI